jgi:hypothetical protein
MFRRILTIMSGDGEELKFYIQQFFVFGSTKADEDKGMRS